MEQQINYTWEAQKAMRLRDSQMTPDELEALRKFYKRNSKPRPEKWQIALLMTLATIAVGALVVVGAMDLTDKALLWLFGW